MNSQFYKLSYILNVRIIWTNIKIKNKKIEQLILCYFIFEISKLRNIGRSTFGRFKFWPPPQVHIIFMLLKHYLSQKKWFFPNSRLVLPLNFTCRKVRGFFTFFSLRFWFVLFLCYTKKVHLYMWYWWNKDFLEHESNFQYARPVTFDKKKR